MTHHLELTTKEVLVLMHALTLAKADLAHVASVGQGNVDSARRKLVDAYNQATEG